MYQPERVGAWVGYPINRLLSLVGTPGEGGPLVCIQPYILLAFIVNLNIFILQSFPPWLKTIVVPCLESSYSYIIIDMLVLVPWVPGGCLLL